MDPLWSEAPKQFKYKDGNLLKEYVNELSLVSYRLHILAAYALKMETNYFEQFMLDDVINNDHTDLWLRLNYYFKIENNMMDEYNLDAARLGVHTDYHGFTVLFADDIKGLEVYIGDDRWLDIVGRKDGFIVNAGDLIPLWTLNRWKSAKHRVLRTSNKERISLSYFDGPRGNLIIEPFPECSLCRKTAVEAVEHSKTLA